MPSTLAQTLDRELRVRGGVTRSLGRLLVATYGLSDLTGELTARATAAAEAEDVELAWRWLQLDAGVKGCLPEPVREQLVALVDADRAALAETYRGGDEGAHTELFVAPRPTVPPRSREERRIGRNDPCPCGSGKKFKKCHVGREEDLAGGGDSKDEPGMPGVSHEEAFVFRYVRAELNMLCQARLEARGPRAGETLFWPLADALDDELNVRARLAAESGPIEQAGVVTEGWRRGALSSERCAELLEPTSDEQWSRHLPVLAYRELPAELAEVLAVAGPHTAAGVVALADEATARDALIREALQRNSVGVGDASTRLIDGAQALAKAGAMHLAFLLARTAQTLPQLDDTAVGRLARLDGLLAPLLGQVPAASQSQSAADQAAEIARLRREVGLLETELKAQGAALSAERELRQRAREAWTSSRGSGEGRERLQTEVRALKSQLQTEHEARREAERTLQSMRKRERSRLLRQSQFGDTTPPGPAEPAEPEGEVAVAPKPISYSDSFDEVAPRLPASTIQRVRAHVSQLAAGKWVREAKRMEGCDGVWTLRAGLHYRALIRDRGDRFEVFDLIPREDLDAVLAKLRSS